MLVFKRMVTIAGRSGNAGVTFGQNANSSADGLRGIRFDFNRTYPPKNPQMYLMEYKTLKYKKVEIMIRRIYSSRVSPE